MQSKKVDFFICGVQKGGTTALDTLLRSNPAINMAATKEPHFFDDDNRDWVNPDYSELHAWFAADTREQIRGEATPIYSYWPNSMERVSRYNPNAHLIICLRHPAFRAYSHWKMEFTRGLDTMSFDEAIREKGRIRVRSAKQGVHRRFSYVERGFYSQQIRRIAGLFRPAQLFFLRTDYLWSDVVATVGNLCLFLGVEPHALSAEPQYIAPILTQQRGINPENRDYLTDLFRTDIELTEQLTGIALSDWLDPNYQEPMRP